MFAIRDDSSNTSYLSPDLVNLSIPRADNEALGTEVGDRGSVYFPSPLLKGLSSSPPLLPNKTPNGRSGGTEEPTAPRP